jgi:DNA-binding beta-propeller fold protein YncE
MTGPVSRLLRLALTTLLVIGGIAASLWAQPIDLGEANAREEFRFGVQVYHASRFNDAIVAFTRALSFTPDNLTIREWLGRAYYRSGLIDAAMAEWEIIADEGAAGAYLLSRLDTMRYRQGVMPFQERELTLARSQLLNSGTGERRLFQRPAGVATDGTGDMFVVSLGTQEILRITPNGRVRERITGGLTGLDRPFDVAYDDGVLYVTEYGSDRVSVLGDGFGKERMFGGTGLGEGQLLGPQFIAIDEGQIVYVTEWGNRRVSKYTSEGEFLQTIGSPSPFFEGLQHPTGIAVRDQVVYVADRDDEGVALHLFDESGNHLRRIDLPLSVDDAAENSINGAVVEDLAWYDEQYLLIAAGREVLLFDPETETVESVINDAERARVSSAARDANGRVIVTDFDADEVAIFEPEGALYSGLDVRIERIVARDFPRIALQVAVHDREGSPLVGLNEENFIISEDGVPNSEITVDSSGQSVERLEVSVLLQPRGDADYGVDVGTAAVDLTTAMQPEDRLRFYLAGEQPRELLSGNALPERIRQTVRESAVDDENLFEQDRIRLDRSIRLAATPMLDGDLRRDLVMIGDGRVTDGSFDEYGVEETAAFLVNNGIQFHVILTEQQTPAAEIQYLVEETGGSRRYLYEAEGIGPMVQSFRSRPIGRYWITLNARQDTDFGRRYFEISVETRLFVRSGRDELGFFGPSSP